MYVVKCVACQGKKKKHYIFKYINDDFGDSNIWMLLDYSLLICMLLKMSLSVNCLVPGGTLVALFVFLFFFFFFLFCLINVVVKIRDLCFVICLYCYRIQNQKQ